MSTEPSEEARLSAVESCDECGFVYASVPEREIGARLRSYGTAIAHRLVLGNATSDDWREALRGHTVDDVWSPLEYACHVADALAGQQDRLQRALAEATPVFAPLGLSRPEHVATYASRDAADVRLALIAGAEHLAAGFDSLTDAQLARTCVYNWPAPAERTLAWVGRHTVHEARHHLGDIDSGIARAPRFLTNQDAGEIPTLLGLLEFHRATLRSKCAGLDDDGLRKRSVGSSTLSLIGLVRHMATVEFYWFQEIWSASRSADPYCTADDPDGDFDNAVGCEVGEAFARWQRECAISRRVVGDAESLDQRATRPPDGRRPSDPTSLRWILTHMIEEYARHNGHADLLRELADGKTGD